MKITSELRTELFTALNASAILNNNILWSAQPKDVSSFPCLIYTFLNDIGSYVFGTGLTSEEIVFQIDIITEPSDKTNMDLIVTTLKSVMFGIGYRNIGIAAETLDEDIQKLIKPTRWERINV
jgi:hypothetical protein